MASSCRSPWRIAQCRSDNALRAPSRTIFAQVSAFHHDDLSRSLPARKLIRALDLGTHEVGGLQIATCVSHKLMVRGMIRRLDAFDLDHHFRVRMLDVLDELGFLASWSDDEDSAGVGDRPGYFLEKILVLGSVAAADRVRLVVKVANRILWAHHQLVHVSRVEVKYARLSVVD